MAAKYDRIGTTYTHTRRTEPRIEALLQRRIGKATRILNIGAGSGSYEPAGDGVIAVEPSPVMLAQRSPHAPSAVQAVAEKLPFADASFELSMTVLSMHHWSDWRNGVAEAMRVSGGRFLTLTWLGFPAGFWLLDYFPDIELLDLPLFPPLNVLEAELGPARVDIVPIPADCVDGFLCAYWQRPEAYLDPVVRGGMSTFAKVSDFRDGIHRLEADLTSGRWEERNGHLRKHDSFDYGYRILSFGDDSQ